MDTIYRCFTENGIVDVFPDPFESVIYLDVSRLPDDSDSGMRHSKVLSKEDVQDLIDALSTAVAILQEQEDVAHVLIHDKPEPAAKTA